MSFTAIITANVQDFEKGVQQAQKSIDGLEKGVSTRLQNIGTKFTEIGQRMSLITVAFVAAGGASFKMAADFQDAMGATEQVFKTVSKAMQDWAQNLSPQYGIAKGEALQYSNMMGSMLVNIGQLTEEQAAKQAQTLIMLAGDLTAMFGGTTADAVRALTGALKGNNSMLDNYGMAVNDATVKARALEMGLVSQGKEMSLAAKQAATLSLIMDQSGAAQGQASREADGASGSMRQLQTEIKNLSTQFGEVLLPVITPIISAIGNFVSSLRNVSPAMLTVGVVIAGMMAALSPLFIIIGQIIAILPTLKAGFLAVSVAIGGITAPVALAVAGIAALVGGIIYFSTRTKEATSAADAFARINKIANESIIREIAQLNVLLKIARDEKISKDKRLEAIEKINAISPQYLGALKLETIGTKQADAAVKNYTDSLRENARQRAILSKVTELETQRVGLEEKLLKEQGRKLNPYLGGTEETRANAITLINRQISAIDKQIDVYSSFVSVTKSGGTETKKILDDTNLTLTDTNKIAKSIVELSVFDELIGDGSNFNEIVKKLSDKIKELEDNLSGLRNGRILSKNIKTDIENTTKKVGELKTALTSLTGGAFGDVSDMGKIKTPDMIITPIIDTSKIDVGMAAVKTKLADAVVDLTDMTSSGITSFAQIIGKSFGSGNWDNIGSELISAIGGLAQQFGSMLIGMGVAALALKKLVLSPMTAIAAGVALVALGAAASAAASNMVNKTTGGGGASYGGGATGSYQSVSTQGASEYRGQYQDEYTVNFKIGNDELIGTLERANQKRNRI